MRHSNHIILRDPRAVSSGKEMKRRRFISKAEKAPGHRLLPEHFQMALRMLPPDWAEKSFVLFCPIGEQQLLRYYGVFLHEHFHIAIFAWFVHQPSACERNFHFNFPKERRNIEVMTWDTISDVSTRAILKWTGKFLFSDRSQGRIRLFYRSFITVMAYT